MTEQVLIDQSESPQLPAPVSRRGIDEPTWRALTQSVFPGAASQSVLMAWDYCKARRLDPLKKVVHIVPMRVKDAKTGNYEWRDVIMPGIAEHRTTAVRTGQYAGKSKPKFGPMIEYKGLTVPESCEVTVYRLLHDRMCSYTHEVFFSECVVEDKDGHVNKMWSKRSRGQMGKCAEAGALREAFPEELGSEPTAEEMNGKEIIEATVIEAATPSAQAAQATLGKIEGLRAEMARLNKDAPDIQETYKSEAIGEVT